MILRFGYQGLTKMARILPLRAKEPGKANLDCMLIDGRTKGGPVAVVASGSVLGLLAPIMKRPGDSPYQRTTLLSPQCCARLDAFYRERGGKVRELPKTLTLSISAESAVFRWKNQKGDRLEEFPLRRGKYANWRAVLPREGVDALREDRQTYSWQTLQLLERVAGMTVGADDLLAQPGEDRPHLLPLGQGIVLFAMPLVYAETQVTPLHLKENAIYACNLALSLQKVSGSPTQGA